MALYGELCNENNDHLSSKFLFELRENGEEAQEEWMLTLSYMNPKGSKYLFHYCRISEVIENTLNCRKVQTQTCTIDVQTKIVKTGEFMIFHFTKNTSAEQHFVTLEDRVSFEVGGRQTFWTFASAIHHTGTHTTGHYTA